MQRYFLKLAYKGTNYHGWQIQPNAVSVQETIENAISTILQESVSIIGCGRTDAGVHASDFYLHFNLKKTIKLEDNFLSRLNRFLPRDIVIYNIFPVSLETHARFDALSRTYKYQIHIGKNPFLEGISWQVNKIPDIAKMNAACHYLFEFQDFTSFSKLHSDAKTNNCKIMHAEWELKDNQYIFTIRADRFLRNMVRAIVGSLIEISNKELPPEHIIEIIEAKDRSKAGQSVPAHGLFLKKIEYPENIFQGIINSQNN